MRVFLVAALALSSVLFTGSGSAQTARKGDGKVPFSREAERAKANENLLVIMGGGLGGPYLQLAHDIAMPSASDARWPRTVRAVTIRQPALLHGTLS